MLPLSRTGFRLVETDQSYPLIIYLKIIIRLGVYNAP